MGYTATEMYDRFLLAINESGNDSVLTWEVAKYLNQAQIQLYNELIYPLNHIERDLRGQAPFVVSEENLYNADILSPFRRTTEGTSSVDGKVLRPADAEYVISVSAKAVGETVCGVNADLDGFYEVEYLRENEWSAKQNNSFTKPKYSTNGFSQLYYSQFRRSTGEWIDLLPKIQYEYRIAYYKLPVDIVIANTSLETSEYSGLPNYENNPTDVDCEFRQAQQDDIIRRAVVAFGASTGNYNAMQSDIVLNKEGRN